MWYKNFGKRFLDFLLALVGVILLFPLILVIWLLLAIANKGKPFFVQERPGKDEKVFYVLKFRTMTDERDANGELLPDGDRITRIGAFVRKTSLDEIPQLFNVLKGEMSFIGPRPFLVEYLPYYTPEERERHSVRPGITGLAQVSGRNMLSWEEKFRYDLEYVQNLSLKSDIKIWISTFEKVFKKSDILVNTQELNRLDDERKNECVSV